MNLVIYTNEELSKIQKEIHLLFSKVKNNNLGSLSYANTPKPFTSKELLKLRRIKTVHSKKELSIYFPLPSYLKDFKSNPLKIIEFLVKYKGKGSFLSLLIENKLATDLSVNTTHKFDLFSPISININLTDKGLENYSQIVEYFFEFIQLLKLKKISKKLFLEIQQILNLVFTYKEKSSGFTKVRDIALNLSLYPTEYVNKVDYLLESYEPEKIETLLNLLTPDNMLLTLKNNNFDNLSQKDPYFGTEYQDDPLSAEFVKTLQNILKSRIMYYINK